MDLSVVVCAHNEESSLGKQLDSLTSQEWDGDWEIVVVDNRSSDSTAEIARAYVDSTPPVRIVSANVRNGKCYAMSVGVAAAKSDRLAFCDADDIAAPGWVAAIADGLSRHQVVTGPHEIERLNPRWLADSRGRSIEEPVGTFYGIFPCIRGAGWGVQRSVWEELGGMDEDFTAAEDLDFSLRCWINGFEIIGLPTAVIHYRYRRTTGELWRQGFAYGVNRPRIARRLIEAKRPRPPRFSGWRSWALLALRLPMVTTREGRAVWTWIAANRVGQVMGSVRERTLMI